MDWNRTLLPALLVVAWTLGFVVVGVVAGATRNGIGVEVAAEVMASAEARHEVAQHIASDFRSAAPLLSGLPGLEQMVHAGVDSPLLRDQMRRWVEHGVRARLGHDVGPLILRPGDIIESDRSAVSFGVAALPAISIDPAPGLVASSLPVLQASAAGVLVSAIATFVVVRRRIGRAWAEMLVGLAGLVAAGLLTALPHAVGLAGELPRMLAGAVVTPTVSAVILGLSMAIGGRGLLAHTTTLPYRRWADGSRSAQITVRG